MAYLQVRAARSLSQFVCLSVGSGQLQCEVHACMVRKKGVGAFLSRSGSLLGLSAKEAEAPPRWEEADTGAC